MTELFASHAGVFCTSCEWECGDPSWTFDRSPDLVGQGRYQQICGSCGNRIVYDLEPEVSEQMERE